jgi:hypothetical protein
MEAATKPYRKRSQEIKPGISWGPLYFTEEQNENTLAPFAANSNGASDILIKNIQRPRKLLAR